MARLQTPSTAPDTDRAGTPYAVLMGSAEQEKGVVTLKHLRGGSQEEVPLAQITARLLALRAAG